MSHRLAVASFIVGISSLLAAASTSDDAEWHRLVGILQYVEVDYPAAFESRSSVELDEQRAFLAEAVGAVSRLGATAEPFKARIESIRARVDKTEDAAGVSRDCKVVVDDIVATTGMVRAPTHAPDLAVGRRVYETSCAACHGVDGAADTPLARTLSPRPASFVDAALMDGTSPYRAFNMTTFGVPGTPMVSFKDTISADERWAVAFYVFTLRQPRCADADAAAPSSTLGIDALATSTDAELAARGVAVACARRVLPALDEAQEIAATITAVEDAVRAAEAGDKASASRTLVDAYLEHVEPLEPKIAARDPRAVATLEEAFWDLRSAVESGRPDVAGRAAKVSALLRNLGAPATSTRASSFWLALFIVLREGFESMVVVVALLAALKTMGQQQYARVVHLGWISALIAGAAAFFLGQRLLAGARREWLEGVVALVAVVMLVYAATWLSARTHMRRYMGELREKISERLGKASVAGIFALAFTAAGRETFETALFLQGIGLEAPGATAAGAAAGLALLALLVIVVMRVGYRLPMQLLFKASTALLCVTAVILLGKGVHALQEVGAVPIHESPGPRLELLGIYPDALTLGAQALLGAGLLLWALRRRSGVG